MMDKKMAVAVLGGGLLGRLMAWQLARLGHHVALCSESPRSGEGAAAYVAAAMLAPLAEAIDGTPLAVQLGYDSLPLWRQWLPEWPMPVFMQEHGALVVWHAQDKPLADQFVHHLRRAHHGEMVWQSWAGGDVAAQEPQLAGRFQAGLFLPAEGQLDNRQVLLALAAALESEGVVCQWQQRAEVAELAKTADWVVDCRGVGAKSDWNQVPSTLSGSHDKQGQPLSRLRGVRGEVLRVWAPEVTLNRPVRLLHPRYPLYIAPKQNHLFVIGATQLESEDDGPLTVRSGLELMSALYAVHPAFGEARVLESATSLRPTLNHENPEIRCDSGRKIMAVNGLFRHGFMIAPAVSLAAVRVLQALMVQQEMPSAAARYGVPVCRLSK
ncbi:FAD-dependent oxidoreductase [Snodgrassella sp. CFCC 13594]|uniref:FAD-dependent oxidoreductase n=1 Tax=Snodgrassella sp. CFCC 13594 TaxID=1775559 RepID=UPI000A7F62A1